MTEDFARKVQELSAKAISSKDSLLTEEATKMSLIVPMFAGLETQVLDTSETEETQDGQGAQPAPSQKRPGRGAIAAIGGIAAAVAVSAVIAIAQPWSAAPQDGAEGEESNNSSNPITNLLSGTTGEKAASGEAKTEDASKGTENASSDKAAGSTESSGSSSAGASGGSSSSGGSAAHEHSWASRYVVDVAAHEEFVPIEREVTNYTQECYVACSNCGADITNDLAHAKANAHYGCYTAYRNIPYLMTITETSIITVPESGHTETYCTGCGAVQ